jgi:hypothetical protein
MASCFPFMKYIFLVTLCIICFALMFSTSLEFLGLTLFFVVNFMYSASLGIDLSSFIHQTFSDPSQSSWQTMLNIFITVVSLILCFVASVLLIMTLANLHYKFGEKGEPILLSPTYRSSLDHIKGLFISGVVLITLLTIRMYLTPQQVSYNIFDWVSNLIPSSMVNILHFVICIVVAILFFVIINHISEKRSPELPSGFTEQFMNLFFVLFGIFCLYFIAPLIYSYYLYTGNPVFGASGTIPAYNLFIVLVSSVILGLSAKCLAISKTAQNLPLVIIGILSSILYLCIELVDSVLNLGWAKYAVEVGFSIVLLLVLIMVDAIPNTKNGDTTTANESYHKLFGAIDPSRTDSEYVYSKIIVSLLMLYPIVSIIAGVFGYDSSQKGIFNNIIKMFQNMSNERYTPLFSVDETFRIVKWLLVMISIIFTGFTINEYNQIPNNKKYIYTKKIGENDYSVFHFKQIFIALIVLLMIVLTMSFINVDSFTYLFGFTMEYIAPIAALLVAALLVYYTNNLAELSKKNVIADVKRESSEYDPPKTNEIPKTKIPKQMYDGTPQRI